MRAAAPNPTPHPLHSASKSSELDPLFNDLYQELKGLAARSLRDERAGHTLQPTALAHEAYVRMAHQHSSRWVSRAYVLSVAAHVIRRILVDHARARGAQKRGGSWTARDLGTTEMFVEPATDVIDVHDAIEALALLHSRQARVVELRFFGGLEVDDVATVLGVSPRTVANDWRVSRAFIRKQIAEAR